MNGENLFNGKSDVETQSYRTEIVIFLQKGQKSTPIQVMSGPAKFTNKKVYSSTVVKQVDKDCVIQKFQKGPGIIEKDGRYFLDLVNKESSRLENFCKASEVEMTENNIPEEGKLFYFNSIIIYVDF